MMLTVRIAVAGPGSPFADVVALGVPATGLDLDRLGLPAAAAAAIGNYLRHRADPRASARPGSLERLALAGDGPRLIYLVGIGHGSATELRAAGGALGRAVAAETSVSVSAGALNELTGAALAEGLLLGDYRFRAGAPTGRAARSATPVVEVRDADAAGVARGVAAAAAARWTRELANTRSSVKTPAWLAAQARAELTPLGIEVTEYDAAWLTEHGFGGILAVGSGSAAPPRLIEASWRPRGARPGRHVVLVGKSITYDSGGINIKPLDSMMAMYTDMAGGAAVLGALRLAAELRLPIRVTGLLPAAENSVSGSAMRQTDVVRHYGGRTSEVNNTDAEGRLVLADAMAYAVARLRPSVLIDLATLTGAMKVALGVRTGGLFASTDELAAQLIAAGEAAGEPLWRLPLAEDYRASLKSEVADASNSPGNPGGIAAALYLQAFSGGLPWAHIDIAGPARSSEDVDELSEGATGFGARLLAEWLTRL